MKSPALKKMILTQTHPVAFKDGEWTYETQRFPVRVMAVAEGYAMVRRPRAMPFVCHIKDLSTVPNEKQK